MSAEPFIEILPANKIDKDKWNACLQGFDNNLIYAQYDYLRIMTDNWCGLIVNDYEAVMPLPYRTKMGIRYCYTVPFLQQLGLFGKYDEPLLKKVISKATKHIQYGDLFFNFQNNATQVLPDARTADNYVLNLHSSYPTIYSNYTQHLKTKLKKAKALGLVLKEKADISKSVFLFSQLYSGVLPNVKPDHFDRLLEVANFFSSLNQCFAYEVLDCNNNSLAMALFFKDENRIYNILPSTTSEGRKLNAMHFLLDNLIQKYAETQCSLDFEGSDIAGIKLFYQSFGAINQPYYHYHFNHLPFPLRLLKR